VPLPLGDVWLVSVLILNLVEAIGPHLSPLPKGEEEEIGSR